MFSRSWVTASGFVAGTLPYMSPEQADGVRDDPRADLYALGAVLYRMLTGRTYLDFDERDTPGAQAATLGASRRSQPAAAEQPQPPRARVAGCGGAAGAGQAARRPICERQRSARGADPQGRGSASSGSAVATETVVVPSASRPAPPPPAQAAHAPSVAARPLPRWLWPAVGGIAALLVIVVIALIAGARGGGTAHVTGTSEVPVTSPAAATHPSRGPGDRSLPALRPCRRRLYQRADDHADASPPPSPTLTTTPTSTPFATATATATPAIQADLHGEPGDGQRSEWTGHGLRGDRDTAAGKHIEVIPVGTRQGTGGSSTTMGSRAG